MKYIDLHTHSNYSDGTMSPTDVVRAAKAAGLSAIALSDHDTVAGVAEAVSEGKRIGVEVIPAIELSAQSKTETHILGYFIDPENEELQKTLEYAKKVRELREHDVVEKLREHGFEISMDELRALAGSDVLCRAHIAKLMVQKGYVSSVKEAFSLWLASGRPAYSARQALTDSQAVQLIKSAGGLAFVAHLNQTRRTLDNLEEFLTRLKAEGLDGIEGIYTEYTPEQTEAYGALADKLGLIKSGGSDFHADNKPHISIGRGTGDLRVPYTLLEIMKNKHQRLDTKV